MGSTVREQKLNKQQQAEFQKFTALKSEYCKKVLKRAPVLNQQEKIAFNVCGKIGLLNLWQETMDAGTQAHMRDMIMKQTRMAQTSLFDNVEIKKHPASMATIRKRPASMAMKTMKTMKVMKVMKNAKATKAMSKMKK